MATGKVGGREAGSRAGRPVGKEIRTIGSMRAVWRPRGPRVAVLDPPAPAQMAGVARAGRDNTGRRRYAEGAVFPTLDFPSDHALISAAFSGFRTFCSSGIEV